MLALQVSEHAPAVSVVIPTRDRSRRLHALLQSLRAQTIGPEAFEVVVVDDGSVDGTQEVLAAEVAAGILSVRSVRGEGTGPTAARNAGVAIAGAPLIAFTDDDCVTDPDWLRAGIAAWGGDPMRFVQGATTPIESERHLLGPRSYSYEVTAGDEDYQTCNIFYPRELLDRLGGFDFVNFARYGGEDTDLGWRAREAGATPVFAPDAKVQHAVVQLDYRSAVRRAWSWRATVPLYVLHPELRRRRLAWGVFWNHHHYVTARFWLGVLLPSRTLLPLRLWLARPWLVGRVLEPGTRRPSLRRAAWYGVVDTVEMAALACGSLPHGLLVL
jgi:glycosyltransferase involved in cell wall biosynthesis